MNIKCRPINGHVYAVCNLTLLVGCQKGHLAWKSTAPAIHRRLYI